MCIRDRNWVEYLQENLDSGIDSFMTLADEDEAEQAAEDLKEGYFYIEMIATTTDSEALAEKFNTDFSPERSIEARKLTSELAKAKTMLDTYLRY